MKTKVILGLLVACGLVTAFFLGRVVTPEGRARSVARHPAVLPSSETNPPARAGPASTPGLAGEPAATPPATTTPARGTPPVVGPAPPPGSVAGRVVLEDAGNPAGVKVHLQGKDIERDLELDPSGAVAFDHLLPGRYRLRAAHPDYAPRAFDFEVEAGEGAGPFLIQLKRGGALLVKVFGLGRAPVVGERISLQTEDRTRIAAGETDAAGEWLVERLAPGSYWVRRGDAMRTVSVEPGKTVEVIFEVSCELTGTVFGPGGRPLPGAIVRLTPKQFGAEGYRNAQTRTDEGGRYHLVGFPPGAYSVAVQVVGKHNYVADAAEVEIGPGQILDLPIHIRPSSLSGRITCADTGQPLTQRDVQITARPVEVEHGKVTKHLGRSVMAFADREGRYSFVGLAPGTYQIWIASHHPELSDVWEIVDFRAGGDKGGVDFVLKQRAVGTLRLHVTEPDGSGAGGLYFVQITGSLSTTLHGKEVGDGLYEFTMEAGPRKVGVIRKGFVAAPAEVTVEEGRTVEAEIRLKAIEPR